MQELDIEAIRAQAKAEAIAEFMQKLESEGLLERLAAEASLVAQREIRQKDLNRLIEWASKNRDRVRVIENQRRRDQRSRDEAWRLKSNEIDRARHASKSEDPEYKERRKRYARTYRETHRESIKESQRRYWSQNRERLIKDRQQKLLDDPDYATQIRKRNAEYTRNYRARKKAEKEAMENGRTDD